MEIIISKAQGRVPVTIMQLKGEFDYLSVDDFDAEAKKVVESGARDILIDLSGVTFMSSVGMRAIHLLYDQVHDAEPGEKKAVYKGVMAGTYKAPHLKLLGPTNRVLESLKLIGLDLYIDIFDNKQEALAAF